MKARRLLPALALPLLLLAACNEAKQDDSRTASGEVLQGTIGDSELPLDTVTSQPPLVKSVPSPGAGDAGDAADDEDAESVDAAQPVIDNAAGE